MKRNVRFARSRMARRGGFTLIELLVVVTIIAALMALSASAVMKFIEVQENNNTQSTLDRTQGQLGKAWSKVKDSALKETIPAGVIALAGTDANANGRARIIYVKAKLRQAFPMNFAEALNLPYNNPELSTWGLSPAVPASPLPVLPSYWTYLNNLGITTTNYVIPGGIIDPATGLPETSAKYESSACLLMALQRGVSGAGINPEELTRGGATGSLPTPLGGSIPYLTDAWGRPIFFSRFPVGNLYLNPNGALAGANDPGDPQGYLQMAQWGTTFGLTFSAITLQQLAPTNMSYKLAPMVASSGPVNWMKSGKLTFDPITFQPGFYTMPYGPLIPFVGTSALYSTP